MLSEIEEKSHKKEKEITKSSYIGQRWKEKPKPVPERKEKLVFRKKEDEKKFTEKNRQAKKE